MRTSRLMTIVFLLGPVAAGCGSSPSATPATTAASCTPGDGPSDDTVAAEIAKLPAAQWNEVVSGHTGDCGLHWVVVSSGDGPDSPGQVLFFNGKSPIGTATPQPRPYVTIMSTGTDTASVQYQWRQGQDPACCPTGSSTVRFKIDDGKLTALDPVPAG
jgi:LppP/LprE lipoprotein